jgi:hypothetical protein
MKHKKQKRLSMKVNGIVDIITSTAPLFHNQSQKKEEKFIEVN